MTKVFFQRWVFGKMQDVNTSIEVLDGYNKTKFGKKHIIDELLLLEAAREAHENGLIYFVTVFENELPYCHLEINKGFYRVNFLDEHQRLYMAFDFYGNNFDSAYGDKLFLGKIVFWEFEVGTDKIIKIIDHIFKTDGTFFTIERDTVLNQQVDSEAKNKIDVSRNWEEYPEFGVYHSIIRKERL